MTQIKRKILLVDDDASLLITLGDFLRFEGYDVVTVDSGEHAIAKLSDVTPDLIILDMSMPGMGGVGFLKKISTAEGKPKYPVLVLTARANMAEFFADVDVDGFVAKPCDPSDLLMEIGRIMFLKSGSTADPDNEVVIEKRKVLIGEDDKDLNERILDAFIDAGYIADSVYKGPEILENAIIEMPDVIVMKFTLTGMNADVVAGMLKEMPKTRNIPIVLYDESASDVAESKYTEAGIGIKKFVRSNESKELLKAVGELLQ